jgi:predicted ATPase/DNA-binding CsgD family transcriptional regulator
VALATARVASNAIPADATSFVGRENEVAELKRCLSSARLITLVGPGGVGKTRLAARVAADRRRAFPGGVWLVDLTDLREPQFLDRTVASAVGLREQPGQAPLSSLIGRFGSDRVLLLLDNCEHVLDACAEVTTGLLRACPGLQIIVTSREPLNVAGEMTLTVPPLSLPDPQTLPSPLALGQYGAVSLFVDRAVAVVPSFRLTADNHETVAAIAHRLDGLPLAIELAAARLVALTPQQLLERLADSRPVLVLDHREGPARQLTLRSSIDWSFGLCTPQEQRLWARLSVFSGGFELEAVEGICSDEEVTTDAVLDLIAGLVNKSILICEEYKFGLRYRMLQSFQEYAAEKLAEQQETAELARRHRDWHEQLVGRVNAEWISQRQEYWLERLPHEHPNLRATLRYCRTAPGGAEIALRILVAMPPAYLWARDLLGETRRWLDLALARSTEPSPLRARALVLAAQLAIAQGDLDAAPGPLAEGRELAQRLGDPAALAFAGYACANTAMYTGDLPAAMTYFTESLAACEQLSTLNQRLDTLLGLAIAAGLAKDEKQAVCWHEQIVALTEPMGERFNRSNSLWALGVAAFQQGDFARATQLQRQALELKWAIDDRLGIALSLEALACAAVEDPERAATLLGAASAFWQAGGTREEAQPHLVGYHDECEQRARRDLGDAAYERAFRRGLKRTPEAAVADALGVISPTPAPEPAPAGPSLSPTRLTRREQEVAELIGQGLSNQDIAGALVIAQRTAEGHVENILAKLGFRSRSEVASWVARQRTEKDRSSG